MNTQMEPTPAPVDLRRLRKRIKDRERRFKKMSPERKRVAIAKDVIEQLNSSKFVASNARGWIDPAVVRGNNDKELQDVFLEERCTGCALGALFVCTVIRADELTVGEAYSNLTNGIKSGWKTLGAISVSTSTETNLPSSSTLSSAAKGSLVPTGT